MPSKSRVRPPDRLTELRAESEIICGTHGHSIEWGKPYRKGASLRQDGRCPKCGKVVYLAGSRWPSQPDICGTAVSMDCEG